MSGGGGGSINSVFYAERYHPIQAGSIDGTDVAPHDNAVLRALLCSSAGLYDPFGDPKATGDPYCTVFVGRLSRHTDDETLRKAMSRYGRVKNMRLVRDIVTGASCGYAFVEYETDREMRRAYEDAHHSIIDGSEVLVDYYRQQLMPGWIPRRLGGGLGGKKESGQLRFGGRERPFRAPLRPIPYDELKKLEILPPPVGRYMTRFQVPPPPRRKSNDIDREDSPPRRRSKDRADSSYRRQRSPTEEDSTHHKRKRIHHRHEESHRRSREASSHSRQRSPSEDDYRHHHKRRSSQEPEESSHRRSREASSHSRQRSPSKDDYWHHHEQRSSQDPGESSYRRSREASNRSRQRSPSEDDYRHHHKHRRSREASNHCSQRSPSEDDYWHHHKRRSSQGPGELSPDREDSSYKRGRTSTEGSYSPHRSHRQRHHREPQDNSSSHSRQRSPAPQ